MRRSAVGALLRAVLPFFFLSLSSFATAADLPLRLAYPSVGALISNQVGTIFEHTDILKRHGIAAAVTPLPLGKELKAALVAGQVDVILTSEANFIVLLGEGFDCYAISSLGTGGQMALVVKSDSPYKRVGDLKGKKIATIFGTSLHKPAVEWLEQAGLKPGADVQLLNMRGMGPMNSAFSTGNIDAMVTFDPYLFDGIRRREYRVLEKTDMDLIVLMSAAYARQHPEAISTFNAALRDAAYYMASHKAEANAWASRLSGTSIETLNIGSRTNSNYNAQKPSEIELTISKRFRLKLAQLNDFLFQEKLIPRKASVESYIRDR